MPPGAPIGSAAASLAGPCPYAFSEATLRTTIEAVWHNLANPVTILMNPEVYALLLQDPARPRNWGKGRSRAAARRRRIRNSALTSAPSRPRF